MYEQLCGVDFASMNMTLSMLGCGDNAYLQMLCSLVGTDTECPSALYHRLLAISRSRALVVTFGLMTSTD